MERIEVTDLFEAFYRVMAFVWSKPEFRTQGPDKIPDFADYWYNLEAYLHTHLFLAACARRVYKSIGLEWSPEEIGEHLEVCDLTGNRRPGDAGKYYDSGFDWGAPNDENLLPLIIAGDMLGSNLEDTRLFIKIR